MHLPWLRVSPELSRTVLSKTEEETPRRIGRVDADKIEHEKGATALANTVLEIERHGKRSRASTRPSRGGGRRADHAPAEKTRVAGRD